MNSSFKRFLKYLINVLFVLGISTLVIYMIFKDRDPRRILKMLWEADAKWIGLAVLFILILVNGEALQFKILLKGMKQKISFVKCFMISNVGFFFSQITPGASGGQPLQVVYLTRLGINGFVSTLVCMIITMVYKLALILMLFIVLVLRPSLVVSAIGDVIVFFIVGILATAGLGFFLLFCILKPSLAPKMARGFIRFGTKLHLVKDPQKSLEKMQKSVKQYELASDFVKKHPMIIIKVGIIAFIERFSYFMVAFCVAKALKVQCSLIDVVSMQILVSLAVDMLPIPGASGANEIVFNRLQIGIFGDRVSAGILLNRGITYYLLAIGSGILTLVAHLTFKKPKKEMGEETLEETLEEEREAEELIKEEIAE